MSPAQIRDPITGEVVTDPEAVEAVEATRWIIDHPTSPGRHAT